MCDVLSEALDDMEGEHVALGERLRLLIDLLPEPPDEACL
jgi:hypothetical protein